MNSLMIFRTAVGLFNSCYDLMRSRAAAELDATCNAKGIFKALEETPEITDIIFQIHGITKSEIASCIDTGSPILPSVSLLLETKKGPKVVKPDWDGKLSLKSILDDNLSPEKRLDLLVTHELISHRVSESYHSLVLGADLNSTTEFMTLLCFTDGLGLHGPILREAVFMRLDSNKKMQCFCKHTHLNEVSPSLSSELYKSNLHCQECLIETIETLYNKCTNKELLSCETPALVTTR